MAVAAKFGLVLVGGHKCLNIIKTEDVEQQDKICTNQEREKKNTYFDKKVCDRLKLSGQFDRDLYCRWC